MRKTLAAFFLAALAAAALLPREKAFPALTGPYLGQKPPGPGAEVFAPGIVSTEANEVLIGFFHDGETCLFERSPLGFSRDWIFIPLFVTRLQGGRWTRPAVSSPGGRPWFHGYPDAPPGTVVCFAWRKTLDGGGPAGDIDIWRTARGASGWSAPRNLGPPVNSERTDSWPSLSRGRTLYFFSTRAGGLGRADLYRSRPSRGRYPEVENLGPAVNSEYADHDPFIAPDEGYLMWCSDRPGGFGGNDLYVAYRRKDGAWSAAVNLGGGVNSPEDDTRPSVSADGKWLFFNRRHAGSRDVYWAPAAVIERLRPKD